jgi:DNA-binding NtrC family response regulator
MNSGTERPKVLVIDDDTAVAAALRRLLEQDYEVETLDSAEAGLRRLQSADFDVVVTDLQMPGKSGLELIKTLHAEKPQLPVILLTGHHTTDHAIEASKLGAFDYVVKPIGTEQEIREFLSLISKAIAAGSADTELEIKNAGESPANTMIGRSRPMQEVYKEIGRVAALPVVVLIRGETGTGKEMVARAIHRYSDRADHPFVIVNCVAIPEALLESELFGHEQGAFTGAQSMRVGKFEQADKGTIFLDEIGDMSLATQAKLLRVLQEGSIRRIGGRELINVDVRVLAATHRDLEEAVAERTFREDLYYRLNDASIRLPSLRERREDIRSLVQHFLQLHLGKPAGGQTSISADALRMLQYHSWPGNVRELKNVVQQAALMTQGYSIGPESVRKALQQANLSQREPSQFLDSYVAELLENAMREGHANVQDALTEWVERELYRQAMALSGEDQSQVARWLGVSRPTVRERLLHYDLHPSGHPS